MTAEIISVGTELLLGNIVNTNAAYLAEQCAMLGLSVYYQSVVGDNAGRLADTIRQAMDRFLQRQSLLTQHSAGVDQQTIDRLIQLPETPPPAEELSKGLNLSTLSMIREFLSAHPGEAFTSEQIAAQVHLSRITVRRYVSHMVETHELESSIDYRTGGRPSIQYRYVGT